MPTYSHRCNEVTCAYEWEDVYSIKVDPPDICPKCSVKNVIRLVDGGCGKGIIEYTGHELDTRNKEDVRKLKSEMRHSEKVYSNLLGETNYEKLQTSMDKRKRG